MQWQYRKPIFTFVSNLTSAASNNAFELNWVFPIDYLNDLTHDPSNVIDYKLYRHIERKYPSNLANGGPLIDPANYVANGTSPEPIFKQIATLPASATEYTDDLQDLGLHADEGITYNTALSAWVDGAGANVLSEIFHTDRRIYYKISAETNQLSFNSLPFIYICHTDGVECKSLIAQARWNTFYGEGDTVWFNDDVTGCSRTAVDLVFDVNLSRYTNVWVSGLGNTVYCLDGRNGTLIAQYTLPFNGILGLRVDPDTGDGIVTGNIGSIYRCGLISGTVSNIINTGTPYAPNGNTGLVLVKEDDNHYAYIIANQDVVAKCGIDTAINSVVPRTTFGCSDNTAANIPNVLGITNSTDNAVWVNGHVPIHNYYYYTYTTWYTAWVWSAICPNGEPIQWMKDWWYGSRDNPETELCWCDYGGGAVPERHGSWQQQANTVTILYDNHFLQDIGYVYGASNGINAGISNGMPYPYTVGTYKPFTSKTNRLGWFGVSQQGSDTFGRPYTDGCSVSPNTNPNPGLSQKGLASDFAEVGNLSGSNYNIFQTNELENRVHKLVWNGSTLDYNYDSGSMGTLNADYWSITNPVHINVDSQNNIWVLQENTANELTVIYQLTNNTTFPYGGNSRWSTIQALTGAFGKTTDYIYGNYTCDPYIEYYLTRDTTFVGVTSVPTDGYRNGFGAMIAGNIATQKETARTWCLAGTNYQTTGKKIYTHYAGISSTNSFPRVGGDTTEYNSDNIGTLYAIGQHTIESNSDTIHPTPVYPYVDLKILKNNTTPENCDGTFWNVQAADSTNHTSVSGYDDFQVQLSATIIDMGSFSFEGYDFYYDDKTKDLGGNTNPTNTSTQNNVVTYVFHDPSINGKPNSRWTGYPAETNGSYNPYVVIDTNTDCYILSGVSTTVTRSNTTEAIVWERWPTARFYVTPTDTSLLRQQYLLMWNLTSYIYPVGSNTNILNPYSDTRIVSGYDPLSASFTDVSISRTWPLSDWFWTFGDKPEYGGFLLSNTAFGLYPHVTSQLVVSSTPPSFRDDCTTEHPYMVEHLYKGPGTYYATLYVRASNTGTDSWSISAGVTDQNIMVSSFVIAASRQIDVLEICPNMTFEFDTAYTVPSTYSDDGTFSVVSANIEYNGGFTTNGLISGYSPYLLVSFEGNVTARSLPFSALTWDYSDPFSDVEPQDVTLYGYPTAGWPTWNSDPYYVSGYHVFVMPGFYNVSLVPIVSSPQPNYISNCGGMTKYMHIYVEEIPPVACFTTSLTLTSGYVTTSLSGVSPVTIYVNPSCTYAGSFPICRIDWDFGDRGLVTVSRLMSSEYINYYNTSSYNDLSDPRNIVVSHEYFRKQFNHSSTYNIGMSAFACNTNTMATTNTASTSSLNSVISIEPTTLSIGEGDVHLIENRMFSTNDDLLLVFEGQKALNNYTILLSTMNM